MRLMHTLNVPLRCQNEALAAAGFRARFEQPGLDALPDAVRAAIVRMLDQQEPFPMTVLAQDYRLVDRNRAADRLLDFFVADRSALSDGPIDMVSLILDERLVRNALCHWTGVAQGLIARLQREVLRTADERLVALLERALSYPGVNPGWRYPDDQVAPDATLQVWLEKDATRIGFLTTLTRFSAPGMVSLEELVLESYFPLDEATRRWCTCAAQGFDPDGG